MIRMKKQDKEAWLKALREETYPRGKGSLKDNSGGYCCVGVLQMVLSGEVETWNDDLGAIGMPTPGWWLKHGISSPDCEFVSDGLMTLTGVKRGDETFKHIPAINDATDLTFPEIADLLDPIIEVY